MAAELVADDSGTYDCAGCSEYIQRRRGCSRHGWPRPRTPSGQIVGGSGQVEFFHDCVANLVPPWALSYARAYQWHRSGGQFLPGSPSTWPAIYAQALGVLSSAVAEIEDRRRRKASKGGDGQTGKRTFGR